MLYVLNRLKKSKMGEIGLNRGEIAKIGWNRAKSRFQDRFCDCAKMMRWNKISPLVQLSGAYWLWKCTVTRLSSFQFSLHNSQFTKYYFYFPTEQIHNSLIWLTNWAPASRQPQKRRRRSPFSTKAVTIQSSRLLFP